MTFRKQLPKTWPLLDAGDISHGRLEATDNNDCRCLLGHALKLCDPDIELMCSMPFEVHHRGKNKVLDSVLDALHEAYGSHWRVESYNDCTKNKRLLARIWNRAGYLRGYVVGNPEKKRVVPTGM